MSIFYETYIVPPTLLIPLIIALINYKLLDNSLKTIVLYLITATITCIICIILVANHRSNLVVYHIYAIFEFALISWFYKLQFNNRLAKAIPVLIITFAVLCIINFYFIQKNIQINTYTRSLEAIIITGYSIMLFNRQSNIDDDYNWGSISLNWINAGLLIYYATCLLIFIFSNYLIKAGALINNIIWNIHATITALENILFAIGFYKCKKQQTTYIY